MAAVFGQSGSVAFNSVTYAVNEWSLDIKNDVQELTTTASAGWEERGGGIASASGSFKLPITGYAQLATLQTAIAAGTVGTGTFTVGATGKAYTGSFILTNVKPTNPAKGYVMVDCSVESTGAITGPA